MQQIEQTTRSDGNERRRVEAVVETLATLHSKGESLAEVAHDARNMVTALGLYCDLLEEPGVLATQFLHYGSELRLVAAASRRLVEKLVALDAGSAPQAGFLQVPGNSLAMDPEIRNERSRVARSRSFDLMAAEPINNLAAELKANRNLLAALAGPSIAVTVEAEQGFKPVRMTAEDLTRVLINLVKNSAEAMPAGGWIHLLLSERAANLQTQHGAGADAGSSLLLTVEDNGPGISGKALTRIFASGYTTRSKVGKGGWPATHRGLGLSIARSIVEGAGGRIHAANSTPSGARFEIELPILSR
ncbi:MAG: sensor histidine kinase [Terracidiphilus sp.]|jgi:signal transduction histidine kinase